MAIGTPDPTFQFGDFRGATDVDDAIVNIIDYWGLSYLREVARRAGEEVDEFKSFRSHRITTEMEKMPEDQTPGLIIANLGTADTPIKQGTARPGKSYNMTLGYQIGVLLSARGKKVNAAPRAQYLAKQYALAMRLLLIQKRDDSSVDPRFKDVIGMADWVGEDYNGLDSEDDRTICLAHTDFQIWVPDSAAWATGPMIPDIDEPVDPDSPTWPTVDHAILDIVKEPTGGE
jgi:hypothetical protein